MQSNLKNKYRPLGVNVLVSKLLPEAKTAGGILLPERALPNDSIYTVIAIGDGLQRDGTTFTPGFGIGDRVLVPNYMGTPLPENDNYKIITMDTPLSVVEEN